MRAQLHPGLRARNSPCCERPQPNSRQFLRVLVFQRRGTSTMVQICMLAGGSVRRPLPDDKTSHSRFHWGLPRPKCLCWPKSGAACCAGLQDPSRPQSLRSAKSRATWFGQIPGYPKRQGFTDSTRGQTRSGQLRPDSLPSRPPRWQLAVPATKFPTSAQ